MNRKFSKGLTLVMGGMSYRAAAAKVGLATVQLWSYGSAMGIKSKDRRGRKKKGAKK